jgi:hypothetical protein
MTTYGYKTWVSGDTLDAADAMTYLMKQNVTIWETQNARDTDTAYTSIVIEGNLCFIQADNTLYYYDGTNWKPIATEQYVDGSGSTVEDVLVMLYMETI